MNSFGFFLNGSKVQVPLTIHVSNGDDNIFQSGERITQNLQVFPLPWLIYQIFETQIVESLRIVIPFDLKKLTSGFK